jgi:HlyD family secretion protein
MEIGDPASLEVVVDVLSSDGATIHPGDRVRLAEWTGTEATESHNRASGRVRDIEPAGFTKTSALGVEEQRVNVIVDLDSVPRAVGDGFRVEVSIVVWSSPDVVVVPRSALLQAPADRAGAAWNVFVIASGRAEQRTVRIGHSGGASSEVLDGLRAGDEVIVFPSDQIKAGDRVRARGS